MQKQQSAETRQFIEEHPILSRHPARAEWNQDDAEFFAYWVAALEILAMRRRSIASEELRQALGLNGSRVAVQRR